jgi:hypothetical protein
LSRKSQQDALAGTVRWEQHTSIGETGRRSADQFYLLLPQPDRDWPAIEQGGLIPLALDCLTKRSIPIGESSAGTEVDLQDLTI